MTERGLYSPDQGEVYVARHSIKENQSESPTVSLSPEGVDEAKRVGREVYAENIAESDSDVTIFAGVSMFERTNQTVDANIEGIKESMLENIKVIDRNELKKILAEQKTYKKASTYIAEQIASAPEGTKFVIEAPLHIGDLDMNDQLEKGEDGKFVFETIELEDGEKKSA